MHCFFARWEFVTKRGKKKLARDVDLKNIKNIRRNDRKYLIGC